MPTPSLPLSGKTAVVMGASRGAGKGVALALGSAGCTVYVAARSSRGSATKSPPPGGALRPGTVEETAEEVTARGGRGVAVACDASQPAQLEALLGRVRDEAGALHLLVNAAWGGNEVALPDMAGGFWGVNQQAMWRAYFDNGVKNYLFASAAAAKVMAAQPGGGLIVHVSFVDPGDTPGAEPHYTGTLHYDVAKAAINRAAFAMARDLRKAGVAVVAISPGFMRTELVLQNFGLAMGDDGWRNIADLANSHTPEYLGRAVAALLGDWEGRMRRSGHTLLVADLAREFGFTDVDGTQPPPFRVAAALGAAAAN